MFIIGPFVVAFVLTLVFYVLRYGRKNSTTETKEV